MNYKDFNAFHAHLYYELDQIDVAQKLAKEVSDKFNVPVGRVWDKPVGPHPIGSCQISLDQENYPKVIDWLKENRGIVDVFIHAQTGDDYADHTDHVAWLGKSYELNLDIFKKN